MTLLERIYAREAKREPKAVLMFVFYERPRDFPEVPCVVRLWKNAVATSLSWMFGSLADARAAMPHGLVCIPRSAMDERHIVEAWL